MNFVISIGMCCLSSPGNSIEEFGAATRLLSVCYSIVHVDQWKWVYEV